MVKPHASGMRMIYKYIRLTYGWSYEYIQVTYGSHTSTYEWRTWGILVHTSDIKMTYEYIQVTYGWHTSTYESNTGEIRVYPSDIRMTYKYIRVHDMRMTY